MASSDVLNLDEGYFVDWRLMKVNPDTWADQEEVRGFKSVSIDKDATDDIPLLETSSIVVTSDIGEDFKEGWYRTEALVIDSTGSFVRYPIATMLYEVGDIVTDKTYDEISITGKSALQTAVDKKFLAGEYVLKGIDGAAYVQKLISENYPGPVEASGSFKLNDYYVIPAGATYLSVAWSMLQAAGWCMQIDGSGKITIKEKPKTAKLSLDDANLHLIEPGITRSFDLDGIPNRYYAVDDDQSAYVSNTTESSRTSYQSRGRWIDYVDTSPTLIDGETLKGYAARKLEEMSTVVKTYSYTRQFRPDIYPFDLVSASIASKAFEGELRILTQSIKCGAGISVKEKACEEIALWESSIQT